MTTMTNFVLDNYILIRRITVNKIQIFFKKFYFPAIISNQNDLHDDDDDSQTKLIST